MKKTSSSIVPFLKMVNDRDDIFKPLEAYFDEFFNQVASPEFLKIYGSAPFRDGSYPKVNVLDYDSYIEIEAELAGYSKEDVSVHIENNNLVISGGKSSKNTDNKLTPSGLEPVYLCRELKRSKFLRVFTLGELLDPKSINAKFDNGLLKITISKLEQTKAIPIQKIEIK